MIGSTYSLPLLHSTLIGNTASFAVTLVYRNNECVCDHLGSPWLWVCFKHTIKVDLRDRKHTQNSYHFNEMFIYRHKHLICAPETNSLGHIVLPSSIGPSYKSSYDNWKKWKISKVLNSLLTFWKIKITEIYSWKRVIFSTFCTWKLKKTLAPIKMKL